jgi:hypothetical protein
MRPAVTALLAIFLTACSATSVPTEVGALATGTSKPTASPTAKPTLKPTPTPTARAEADVVVRDKYLIVPQRQDFALLGYQVAARIENKGDAWAKLQAFDSDFVVLDGDGGVTSTGSMSLAYPQYLEPGGIGYLATYDVQQGIPPDRFATVEIKAAFETVSGPEVAFQFTNLNVRYEGSYGLEATGFVTASSDRDFAEVGLICLDPAGAVLAVVSAQLDHLTANTRKAFQTTGPPTQVQLGGCATTVPSATAHDR